MMTPVTIMIAVSDGFVFISFIFVVVVVMGVEE
jgi:hypothetical protein